MKELLHSHPKWKPLPSIYYSKFDTVIRFRRHNHRLNYKLPDEFKGTHRVVGRLNREWSDENNNMVLLEHTSVYTSDANTVDYVLGNVDEKDIISIESPYNQKHLEYLSIPDRTIVFRNKPWYNLYYHKMTVYKSWRNNAYIDDAAVVLSIHEIFDKEQSYWTGMRMSLDSVSRRYAQYGSYYRSFPTVYTNDESAVMLFKMAHGANLNVNIESVITMHSITE